MSELEKLVHASYEGLLSIDGEGAIYDDPHHLISKSSPRIVDESTLSAIDLSDLFSAINYTQTKTGAATLFRSLVEPLDSLELISEKQNSLRELENDKKKRDALSDYLNLLAKREPYMHRYLFQSTYCQNEPHNLRFVDQYKLYRECMEFFKNMVDGVKDLPRLGSPYIGVLVGDIQNIDGKRVFDLIRGSCV
jgi:DNA mismatch repair protein MutS